MHIVIRKYIDLYRKVYDREPKELKVINSEFIIVNNMQVRIADLELLINQLEQEYQAQQKKKRSTIKKLIGWFTNT